MEKDKAPSTVDAIYEPKRETDFSRVARLASFAMKWQWVLWVIFTAFVAIGFDFETPSAKFNEVNAEIVRNRTTVRKEIDTLSDRLAQDERKIAEMYSILEGLAIDACDRLRNNSYAAAKLNCKERRQ